VLLFGASQLIVDETPAASRPGFPQLLARAALVVSAEAARRAKEAAMAAEIRIRRVYDQPSPDDGARVLVDRIWPRGLRKSDAKLDEWAKDIAPSTDLRTWYGHDPAKFSEFRQRYIAELDNPGPRTKLAEVHELAASRPVTLLTATRDIGISQAAVLAELLRALDNPGEGGDPAGWPSTPGRRGRG
jgi:uncharacterized protein YeaO (DUF488 family)